MSIYTMDTMRGGKTERFSSGDQKIDWLLGSKHDGWGFARGGLSLWGGEAGVGKTRVLVSICSSLVQFPGMKVLWFQLEQQLSTFKSKYLEGQNLGNNFKFSSASDANKMIEQIKSVQPDLIVVDSINKVDQYRGSDSACKALEKALRSCISSLPKPAHLALITHLNAEGSIKGGTMLPHMVDTVLHIKWSMMGKPLFTINIPDKNRFGGSGDDHNVICCHRDHGVVIEKTGPEHDDFLSKCIQDALGNNVSDTVSRPSWHWWMIPVALILTPPMMLASILLAVLGQGEDMPPFLVCCNPYILWVGLCQIGGGD